VSVKFRLGKQETTITVAGFKKQFVLCFGRLLNYHSFCNSDDFFLQS